MLPLVLRRGFSAATYKQTTYLNFRPISTVPRVATKSFWALLVPKSLRNRDVWTTKPSPEAKPWNPATFFIIIFMLIGSNAINLLAVQKDYLSFSRQADAKIAALKEAIERVQNGEDVDVGRLLGTGDPKAEQEWEDVLKELESERDMSETVQREARKVEQGTSKIDKIVQYDEANWRPASVGDGPKGPAAFY